MSFAKLPTVDRFLVSKIFVSPIHHGTQKRTGSSVESCTIDGAKNFCKGSADMPPPNLLARTDSKRTLQRLDTIQKDGMTMYAKDLPNATIQPFRVWHPSRIKTGLRNRPIGKKIAII